MKTVAANDDDDEDDDEVVGCERLSLSKHAANCCEEEKEEVDVQDDDVHDHLSLSLVSIDTDWQRFAGGAVAGAATTN